MKKPAAKGAKPVKKKTAAIGATAVKKKPAVDDGYAAAGKRYHSKVYHNAISKKISEGLPKKKAIEHAHKMTAKAMASWTYP